MHFAYLSDAESILLVLACLYLWECLVWVPEGAVCFTSPRADRRPSIRFGLILRNDFGGFLLANPLPSGFAMVCRHWPLSLSPEGIYAYAAQAFIARPRPRQAETYRSWDAISRIEASDRSVLVNGDEPLFKSHAALHAAFLAGELRSVRGAAADERPTAIRRILGRILDGPAAAARREEFRAATKALGPWSSIFFLYTFVAGPALLYVPGLVPHRPLTALLYLLGFVGLWLIAMVRFHAAHGALFPDDRKSRRRHVLGMLFCPMATMRAVDLLARDLAHDLHPLAVAHAWCDRDGFRQFAADLLRDLRHPLRPVCPATDAAAARAEQWFRDALLEHVQRQLQAWDEDLADLQKPPTPDGPRTVAYCPRCHGQFEVGDGVCVDCGGLPLERLPHPNGSD